MKKAGISIPIMPLDIIALFFLSLLLAGAWLLFLGTTAAAAADALVSPGARVTWDSYADQGSIKGFIVYTQAIGSDDVRDITISDPAATSYALNPTNFEPGKTYRIWITAFNDRGESDPAYADRNWQVAAFAPPDRPPDIFVTIPGPIKSLKINISN